MPPPSLSACATRPARPSFWRSSAVCSAMAPASPSLSSPRPKRPLFRRAYQAWARGAVPALALAVRGERRDYDYLVDSIDAFAGIEAAGMMLREAGFRRVRSEALALGLVGLHLGWKI